jgi:hypothetical protein
MKLNVETDEMGVKDSLDVKIEEDTKRQKDV